ncbi:MAG: polymerase sigma-70 factor, subfamily [Frankiaceae bacterium]|nr:polymerase sigma-70 factor, subfamily [Frankiaceae bacterium]
MDDRTRWLLAARDGDATAAAAFIRATQADVWRLCAHLGDAAGADDLTQETYARAWRSLPSFRADASARTWLLAIARRVAADAVRSSVRRRRLDAALPRPEQVPDPAHGFAVTALLAALPVEQRTAFVATQLLGLSYDEAAEVCGCPVGTIRSRVARARGELVRLVEEASA